MLHSSRLEVIQSRLVSAFHPTFLEVKDESDHHIGHSGHQGGGRHFAITISAPCLSKLTRVAAHRCIYHLFQDMMPDQIHALRIKIVD